MATERKTEELTLKALQANIGENDFGIVFEQGSINNNPKITEALQKAGGKPFECSMEDYSKGGKGKGQPEYIFTLKDSPDTIIVIECKKSAKEHESEKFDKPKKYAVDGVLYYSKYLKIYYNVISIAVSGTETENLKVDTFYWAKNSTNPEKYSKGHNVLYPAAEYLKMVRGERVARNYSLDEIRTTALAMHNALRENGFKQNSNALFIAGILIALTNDAFAKNYANINNSIMLIEMINSAIKNVLENSGIEKQRIDSISDAFERTISDNIDIKKVPIGEYKSISWFIEQLDNKIKPMMDNASATIDALGEFYHEFVKYGSSDGKILGQVLTPHHLTEFMCELAGVSKNDRVIDICCGSGAFLVTAMTKMWKNANLKEIERIKESGIYGIEKEPEMHTLAVANMIVRKDGKSNILNGNCFSKDTLNKFKDISFSVGLINPPYSQKSDPELKFVKKMLDILIVGGRGVAVVPMSCAIGTKFKEERKSLLEHHTLKAVFSMPSEMFYSNNASTNVCVMLFEAHKPHNPAVNTFFGLYKEDGYVKRKKLGRIDANGNWQKILENWVNHYRDLEVISGLTAKKCVTSEDEWLAEAYLKTDYNSLSQISFQNTLNEYNAYITRKKGINNKTSIDIRKWKKFELSKLFKNIERGKRIVRQDYTDMPDDFNKYPVVTASTNNNGVDGYYSETNCKGNTIICCGEASGMFTTYQPDDCWVVDSSRIFTPQDKYADNINSFTGLFIATVIKENMYKYSYGRKAKPDDIMKIEIVLPVTKYDEPDWFFMENYIKGLQGGNPVPHT